MLLKKHLKKNQIQLTFKFKAFNKYNLNIIVTKILTKINYLQILSTKFVSLPIKCQRFTVLRSPHVDKKSREQFEIKRHQKLLRVYFDSANAFDKQKAKLLINFIKNSTSGIQLKISYKI